MTWTLINGQVIASLQIEHVTAGFKNGTTPKKQQR